MKTSGLTEKNMANQRFYRAERSIFIAFYKLRDYPTVKKLAKTAHVSRSTLYRHHKKIQAISSDYEEYILKEYSKSIKLFIKKKSKLNLIFLRTLVFICGYKMVFRALFETGRKEIVKKMLLLLKPNITEEWGITSDSDELYNIYANEVLGVIENWAKQGFPEKDIEQVLNCIAYLTKTARQDLLPLRRK